MSNPQEFAELMAAARADELEDQNRITRSLRLLQQHKDDYYRAEVKLRNIEGSDTGADYGEIFFRKWTWLEVTELMGAPAWQRNNAVIQQRLNSMMTKQASEQLTKDELRALFELRCDFIARALHPNMGLTKEKIIDLGNWGWVNFVFTLMWEKSGAGTNIDKDLETFFRPEPRGLPVGADSVRADAPLPK